MNLGQLLIQAMGGGMNQEQMLQQAIQQNPRLRAVLPLIQGKTPQQINQTAMNLCRERGVDYNQMAQQGMQMFGRYMRR